MSKHDYVPFDTIAEFRKAYPALKFVQHRRSRRLYSIVSMQLCVPVQGDVENLVELVEVPCDITTKQVSYQENLESVYENFFIPQKGPETWIGKPADAQGSAAAMTYEEFLASGITHIKHKRDGTDYVAVLSISKQGVRVYGSVNYKFVSYAKLATDWVARNNVTRAQVGGDNE